MVGVQHYTDRKIGVLRWIARIWSGLIILFVFLMVIGFSYSFITTGESDPNAEEDVPPIEYSGPILILLSSIGLAVAWKREQIGGTAAVGFQFLFIILHLIQRPISSGASFVFPIIISLFVMIPGLFFLVCWRNSTMEKR